MSLFVYLILSFLLTSFARADLQLNPKTPEKTAFEQALEHQMTFQTKERWIQYGDTRYREVEYRGQNYYIKFTQRAGEFGALDCELPSVANNPMLVEGRAQVFQRMKVFVDFLQESCYKTAGGQTRTDILLTSRLGFTIPDRPGDTLTNKKVYPIPTGLGFSGDW